MIVVECIRQFISEPNEDIVILVHELNNGFTAFYDAAACFIISFYCNKIALDAHGILDRGLEKYKNQ